LIVTIIRKTTILSVEILADLCANLCYNYNAGSAEFVLAKEIGAGSCDCA